jgi:hypothetical protein
VIVNFEDFFLIIKDFCSGRKSTPSDSFTGGVHATRLIDTGFLRLATMDLDRPFGDVD